MDIETWLKGIFSLINWNFQLCLREDFCRGGGTFEDKKGGKCGHFDGLDGNVSGEDLGKNLSKFRNY